MDVDAALTSISLDDPEAIVFEVGQLEAQLGAEPSASMTGGVLLRQGDKLAGAESARFDPEMKSLLLEGGEMVPGYVPAHKLRKALDTRREQTGG